MYIPPDLEWESVSSSNVAAVAYQIDFRRLWVRFVSGAVYAYEDVPEAVWEGFLSASSKGRYVYETIRNGGRDNLYAYRQA